MTFPRPWAFCLLFLATYSSFAIGSCSTQLLTHEDAFRLSAIPLNNRSVEVHIAIEPCHYLYQHKLSFSIEPNVLGQVSLPIGEPRDDPFLGNTAIYRKDLAITLPFSSDLPRGSSYTLKVNYQGCAEAIGFCYPLSAQMLTLTVPKAMIPGEEIFARKPKRKWL